MSLVVDYQPRRLEVSLETRELGMQFGGSSIKCAGYTFTPHVSETGVLSWTNDGGLSNPEPVDIASSVQSTFVVDVSGANPVVVADANCRYMCGTVSTLSFTPPSSGTAEIIFTSGATAAVLTLPNTVMMPEWFTVETNRIYEISITDGVYGAVMSWALV